MVFVEMLLHVYVAARTAVSDTQLFCSGDDRLPSYLKEGIWRFATDVQHQRNRCQ